MEKFDFDPCGSFPRRFPPQHQNGQPGLEYIMDPRPVSERPRECRRLEGKRALITGGDSGIGRAAAYAFAQEGAALALSYLDEDRDALETAELVRALGARCQLLRGDLTDPDFAGICVRRAVSFLGGLDVLVLNHAVQFVQRRLEDISDEQLERTFRTNVFSFFYILRAALPHMTSGSSVILTASVTAFEGNRDLIDYSATKGAIVALTRSLALSLADRGIRVNAVAPGPIWTPLIPSSYSAQEAASFGSVTAPVPMGRAGQPCEVSPSYVFLASCDASYMTGQVLHPNGGTRT